MSIFKVIFSLSVFLLFQLVFAEGAWAWGPAIHTVISCGVLQDITQISPAIARIIQSFPAEYIYGTLSADFFVGKGQKSKEGHSHNWETGFRFLSEVKDYREAAYAFGFFSHLAADVVAHNYFVPTLVHNASTWRRMGHLYWEAKADNSIDPAYIRIAREVLSSDQLGCDDLLKSAVGKSRNGLKARRHIFTQSVKLSDFISYSQTILSGNKEPRYQISHDFLLYMIKLSYRLVKDFLTRPDSSPCLSFDPIGSQNLRLAFRSRVMSKLSNSPRPIHRFHVDQELLKL